jgi:hypothetical protein
MQTDENEVYIAGSKSLNDWKKFSEDLKPGGDFAQWQLAYKYYFFERIKTRYLDPIELVQKAGAMMGEGYGIMSMACSLIEFLESTYTGQIYSYKYDPQIKAEHQYSKSKEKFCDFLIQRKPFSVKFRESLELALDFYTNIRCGILHQASATGGWRVRANSDDGTVVDVDAKIVYRDNFVEAIKDYLEIYKGKLMTDHVVQEAFLRKFNSLT